MLARDENLARLEAINWGLIAQAEAIDPSQRVVLDMDSTEIPVNGQQEHSAYNVHFDSTCYHPLLLFNGERDCLAAKLRPGNVHSAEDLEELMLPEIERQQELGKEVVFRADAAFAKLEFYEALEGRSVKYAIRLPANDSLERDIAELLTRPIGRPSHNPWSSTRVFSTMRPVGGRDVEWWLRSSFTPGNYSSVWASWSPTGSFSAVRSCISTTSEARWSSGSRKASWR